MTGPRRTVRPNRVDPEEWRDLAACRNLAPMMDLDPWLTRGETDENLMRRLRPVANVCAACPVSAACERWADGEAEAGEYTSWIAAGYIYRYTKQGQTKEKITWAVCAAEGCQNIPYRRNRFCCVGCRWAAKAS